MTTARATETETTMPPNTADPTTPLAFGSTIGLGAGSEALCCPECDDGDGNCVYPYYGVAPHIHEQSHPADWLGSTRLLPKDKWGDNFREDQESPGQGVYMRCKHCGRGEKPSA